MELSHATTVWQNKTGRTFFGGHLFWWHLFWGGQRDQIVGPDGNMLSPERIKQVLGLEEVPTHIVQAEIPHDITLWRGRVGAQPDWGVPEDGGIQYMIDGKYKKFWFDETAVEPLISP